MIGWLVVPAVAGPIETDEVGGTDSNGVADFSYKTGAIEVSHTVRLASFAPYVAFEPGSVGEVDELVYVVYHGTGDDDWELVWQSTPQAVGLVADYHPSPPVDLVLEKGERYALGVWFPEGDHAYGYTDPADHADLGWATFAGAIWSATGSDLVVPLTITGQRPDTHGYGMQITVEVIDQDGDGSTEDVDCDEADPGNFPGNPELCDGLDNDCTGAPDDPVVYVPWYVDADGDGYGGDTDPLEVCDGTTPVGRVPLGGDCDEANDAVNPGEDEYCDGLDEDCSGVADDDPVFHDGWADTDLDGYGDLVVYTPWCERTVPAGTSINDNDCDDTTADVHPGATEVCDQRDDDCDGRVDDGLPTTLYWSDGDGDGFGDPAAPIETCLVPSDVTDNPLDCDDTDGARFPGNPEVCDGVDNDCDEVAGGEGDFDDDGFLDCEDCLSADPTGYPGATPVCDGYDHDCDGAVDVDCPDPTTPGGDDPKDEAGGGCGCDASTGPAGTGTTGIAALGLLGWLGRRGRRQASGARPAAR